MSQHVAHRHSDEIHELREEIERLRGRAERDAKYIGEIEYILATLRLDCDCEPAHQACRVLEKAKGMSHKLIGPDEIEQLHAEFSQLYQTWERDAAEIERLRALTEWYDKLDLERIDEIERLLVALTDARDALRNDFEPDNQSRAWHQANDALKQARKG